MIRNIESILNIYNYFDGIIVTDKNGIINYYVNFRTDIYNLRLNQIIGKSILEIHPELKEEDSTIMQVLKTGQPIYDRIEHLTTPHGDCMTNLCSTLPILENGEIVGAIDLSRGMQFIAILIVLLVGFSIANPLIILDKGHWACK